MNVLVIYEMAPEETRVYLLDVDCKSTLARLRAAHGQMVNVGDHTDAALWLYSWLDEYAQVERKLTITTGKPYIPDAQIDMVVVSGFAI